jgi:antitoxin component YwqK of YwqJK toxin-antitoxin module
MIEYTVRVYKYSTEWRLDGKLHREGDLPAIEYANGAKSYYKNGSPHREGDLPAVEWVNGDKTYYKNGKRHRENGAAIEWADGSKEYWLDDEELTKPEWQARVNPAKELTIAEIEKALGHRVKVVK